MRIGGEQRASPPTGPEGLSAILHDVDENLSGNAAITARFSDPGN